MGMAKALYWSKIHVFENNYDSKLPMNIISNFTISIGQLLDLHIIGMFPYTH